MISALLARGAIVTADAMDAVLCSLDPELLAAPLDSPFAARPGAGEVKEGSFVVAVRDSHGLVCGLVHQVVEMRVDHIGGSVGSCTLRRLVDDKEVSKWVPVGLLAVAGEPLGATPLHLASLYGCPGSVVSTLGEANPRAWEIMDRIGRTPLDVLAQVGRGILLVCECR